MVLLTEFDIQYVTRKVIKGCAIVEFLAQQPLEGDQCEFEFPDEGANAITIQKWKMYFDGAVNYKGAGIRVIIVTPEGEAPLGQKVDVFNYQQYSRIRSVYLWIRNFGGSRSKGRRGLWRFNVGSPPSVRGM